MAGIITWPRSVPLKEGPVITIASGHSVSRNCLGRLDGNGRK